MLDAVRAEATLGEICDVLRAEWGDYRSRPASEPPPARPRVGGRCDGHAP